MAAIAELRVRLLGGLAVEGVPVLSLGSRKGRAVLRRLAVAGGAPVAVDDLVQVAWPDETPARAADQLAVLVSRLRSVVGSERLPRTELGYALLAEWLDVRALREHVEAGEASLTSDPQAAAEHGRAAVSLLHGALLPEEPDAEWAAEPRHVVEQLATRARRLAAEAALLTGAPWEALEQAERCRETDPYDEGALRLQLRALAATGRPSTAVTTYLTAAQALREELGTDAAPETQEVYLALLSAAPEPAAAPPPRQQLPGRSAELEVLSSALAAARSGRPRLVVVSGLPGIGKTSLLESFTAALDVDSTVVLWAQGDRMGGALPLQPVLDALATHLRSVSPATARALLEPDAELLAPLLGLSSGSAPVSPLVTGEGRAMLLTALEQTLARVARSGAAVVAVDDAHLLDEASVQLLHHCTRPAAATPLLVVVASRAGEGPAWRGTGAIALGPLDRTAVAEVVGDARADELWGRSGGHPLFLTELARASGESPPDSVLAAIAQRCAGTDDVAATLRVGAVLGLDLDLLSVVLGEPHGAVLSKLEAGARQGLLSESATGFAFSHALFRDAFAAGVGPTRTATLHQAAAEALAARPVQDPLRTAHHALLGGVTKVAATALAAAAQLASDRYEHEEAVVLRDRSLGLVDDPAVRLERARSLLQLRRYDEAREEIDHALSVASDGAALEVAALHAYYVRDLDRALALADEAARATTDPEVAAGCRCLEGRVLLTLGRIDEAEERLAEAADLSTGLMRAVAAAWRALALSLRDASVEAVDLASGPQVAPARRSPLVEPYRLMALGRAYAQLGRPLEALATFDELATVVERQHVTRFQGRAANFRGWVLRNLGAGDEAEEATQSTWDLLGDSTDVTLAEARGHAVLDLADGCLRRGDHEGAHTWLTTVTTEDLAPHVMKWRYDLRHLVLGARLALAVHDGELAESLGHLVEEQAQALGVGRYTVQGELLQIRAAALAGRRVDLERVHALAGRLTAVAPLESWWMLGELARETGDDSLARLASERVVALGKAAGPWTDHLSRAASRALDGLPS